MPRDDSNPGDPPEEVGDAAPPLLADDADPSQDKPPPDDLKRWLQGEADGFGETISRIYLLTDDFVIYATDDPQDPTDLRALRYALRSGDGVQLRKVYHGVSSDIAAIVTAISGSRPVAGGKLARAGHAEVRERVLWQTAQAVAAAFEGDLEAAKRLLTEARDAIETYRDSVVRSRYLLGASLALAVSALLCFLLQGSMAGYFGSLGTGLPAVSNLLLTGAVGSYFSVIYALGKVRVNHAVSVSEMVVLGASRIAAGAIAAGVAVLLIQGGWLLGGIDETRLDMTLLLFVFLAGFSEMFIPNALKETEGKAKVATPA